jgi:hypothetical protein
MIRTLRRRAVLVVTLVVLVSMPAAAQTQVRVVRDQATIWRREARIPATQVKAGTILDVVSREGDWYIVLVPSTYGGAGETGMIAVSLVEPVNGPPRTVPAQPGTTTPSPRSAAPPPQPHANPSAKGFELFGTGHVGLTSWLANDTFAAVTGHSFGPMYGGGLDVRFRRNLFIQAAAEWFQKKGQRVFVSDGQVFDLGISDTVRVIPTWATFGYRQSYGTGTVYGGAGAGLYLYKETSDFADPGEDIDKRFASYNALVGFEFGRGSVRSAVEVQFTSVPNGLGDSGASAAYGERNLGGVQLRLKVLLGG